MSREGSSQLRPFTVDSVSWIFAAVPRRDVHPCPSSSFLSAGGILSKCCGTRIYTASIKQPSINKAAFQTTAREHLSIMGGEWGSGQGIGTCPWAVNSGPMALSHSEPLTGAHFVWSMNMYGGIEEFTAFRLTQKLQDSSPQ